MATKARGFRKLPLTLIKKGILLSMGDLKIENGRLYVRSRIFMPNERRIADVFATAVSRSTDPGPPGL